MTLNVNNIVAMSDAGAKALEKKYVQINNMKIDESLFQRYITDVENSDYPERCISLKDGTSFYFDDPNTEFTISQEHDGTIVFDNVEYGYITGTENDDKYEFNNCKVISVKPYEGNDTIKLNNCNGSHVDTYSYNPEKEANTIELNNSENIRVYYTHGTSGFGTSNVKYSSLTYDDNCKNISVSGDGIQRIKHTDDGKTIIE